MKTGLIVNVTLTLALAGCAGTGSEYQPVVDGPVAYGYSQDLAQCRRVAEQKGYFNPETTSNAVAGAVIGGLLGSVTAAKGEGVDDAIGGAVVGGMVGTGAGVAQAHKDRKNIVVSCMQGRGHPVVG